MKGTESTHLVVLSGLSGGGKTIALRTFEDLGYYCVDNLPAELMPALVQTLTGDPQGPRRIALGVDIRNRGGEMERIPGILAALAGAGTPAELIFLGACDEVLLKRYSDTRRRHPLSILGLSLSGAIAHERTLLKPLSNIADRQLDTSTMNVHQLRGWIATEYGIRGEGLTLMFESFAFRRGLPADADFVFDARCLPNPHWDPALRPLSGKDHAVRTYLQSQPLAGRYLDDLRTLLETWLPHFVHADRSYVTVSIGCTGGRHRSVYLVERLAEHFRPLYPQVLCFHRELE